MFSGSCKGSLSARKRQKFHSNLRSANPENIQRSLETKPNRKCSSLRLQTAQSVGQGLHDYIPFPVWRDPGKRQGVPHHRTHLERKTSAESMQLEPGVVGNFAAAAHWSETVLWWKLQVPDFTVLHPGPTLWKTQGVWPIFWNPHEQLWVATFLLPCECWGNRMLVARDRWVQELHDRGDALRTLHLKNGDVADL